MRSFRVGIDSYCLNPLNLSACEILEWAAARGGEGVQFSEGNEAAGDTADAVFLRELADTSRDLGLYLEWGGGQHVPFNTTGWEERDLFESNRRAAEAASTVGARVVRSCSGGFFRWEDSAPDTDTLVTATAAALRPQRALFDDLGVTLAIELHFEFTTFELLRLFEMCDAEPGGWLGICLDTFNMFPMLEDPVAGTERILPWVVATHVKDGAVVLRPDGISTFPTPLGSGHIDLPAILDLLESVNHSVNLTVESHGGSFSTAIFDAQFMERFPDLTGAEMESLLRLGREGKELFANGDLRITERAHWLEICEGRTEADLRYLKGLVSERSADPH
jgi:sugar phosphate isomerase/epimerase